MLHIYSVLLLHLQIAKYNGFLIKIKVFIDFSAKLKVLKDFNKIKGLFCLFDLGLTSLSTFFSHIATVSGCGRELNAHF